MIFEMTKIVDSFPGITKNKETGENELALLERRFSRLYILQSRFRVNPSS